MSYSSVSYSANSAANSGKDYTYSFPAVTHDTANILVIVGGTSLAITRYTVASSGGTITLEAVPGAGTAPLDVALSASNVLKVYRFTNRTSPEVVFSSTAIIQDEDLNTATDQGRYLALEAVDRANESIAIDEADASRYNVQIDGVDKRIFGIATPTNDKDAANKAYADANVSLAAGSATAAATSATLAGDWATKAEDSPVTTGPNTYSALHHSAKAEDQVALATTQAGNATTNGAAQVTLAAAQVTLAAAQATAAAASFDSFDVRYLGAKTGLPAEPTVDNDGATLLDGALYFNTTADNMRVYDGSAWNVLDALPQGLAASDSPEFAAVTVGSKTLATTGKAIAMAMVFGS